MNRTPAFYFGSKVSTVRLGGYPVTGTVEAFLSARWQGEYTDVAIVRVTEDAGLYRQGDLITVPVTELEAVTS